MKRVVVTGLGPVSSIGIGKETFWENARQGRGYFRNVDFDDVDFDDVDMEQYRSRIVSPIDSFDPEEYVSRGRKLKRCSRATQYMVTGTFLALQDAGLSIKEAPEKSKIDPWPYPIEGVDPMRCGIIIGQSVSNPDIMVTRHAGFIRTRGPMRLTPSTLPQSNNRRRVVLSARYQFDHCHGLFFGKPCNRHGRNEHSERARGHRCDGWC